MRKIGNMLLTSLSLLLASSFAAASDEQLPDAAKQRFEEAKARLELSNEQVELVIPVLRAAFESQKAVLESYGLDIEKLGSGDQPRLGFRKARKLSKELDAERAKTLESLDGILTPSQLKEYERLQAERKKAIREEMRARR